MKQIFVANPKGGCGKTTLATQLASYFASEGIQVALLDHDRQQSSLDWLKARPDSCAPIVPIAAFRGDNAALEKFDYLIHDMPAGCEVDDIRRHCLGPCKLVIPMLASPTDIKAGVRFLMALNRSDWVAQSQVDIAMVANRVRTNTNYYKVLSAFLEQVNMPLVASIRDTQNYIRAMDNGVSIFDLPRSRVSSDLKQWQPLLQWLQAQTETELETA
ncbi:ParA family protein [Pseudomaricurvus alkylphenolicus]|jgi:chromosome partitioning protein|uniref:ParA family protein n=1 Tax=Pseudomaricurvus alkylphenolicus TaxID=1306991 RepID=UPI00142410AA|nr:ParA family protein [Pseudomaricurvus alkylphenolicus]NIB41956.1 ParA family protein [Pseudomaricurvus alkylphenolicus]